MSRDTWSAVDDYLGGLVIGEDKALDEAVAAGDAAGLPPISVAPTQGKFLHLLARIHRARTVLEIGTLAGYSTIWLARALPPDGKVITLEADAKHAEVATANIANAGLADRVDVRLGLALDTLPTLTDDAPFDLFFIDADKQHNPDYFTWALRLSRPGSVIVVDNVIRNGGVLDETSADPSIVGTRRLGAMIANEPRVSATMLQTVSIKGYDGFCVAIVND